MTPLTQQLEDKKEFKFTREWFLNEDNQVHTIFDRMLFHPDKPYKHEIKVDGHFLIDLFRNDDLDDVEIWEVRLTKEKIYCKRRKKWFNFKPIRKITTGKQFGYPNGYWRVPEELQ
jgi:hypothetical protein